MTVVYLEEEAIALVKKYQAEGFTQKAIAEKMELSLSFVRTHWTTVQRANGATGEKIRELQKAGLTQNETAIKLGCSISKVRSEWVRAARTGRPKVEEQKIHDLINAGQSDRSISEALGVSIATVNRARRKITPAK